MSTLSERERLLQDIKNQIQIQKQHDGVINRVKYQPVVGIHNDYTNNFESNVQQFQSLLNQIYSLQGKSHKQDQLMSQQRPSQEKETLEPEAEANPVIQTVDEQMTRMSVVTMPSEIKRQECLSWRDEKTYLKIKKDRQQTKFERKKIQIEREMVALDKEIINMKLEKEYEQQVSQEARKQERHHHNNEFALRQQQWQQRKEQKIREQQMETQMEVVLECSFQPNLSQGKYFGIKSRYMAEGTKNRQKSQPNILSSVRKSSRILPTRFSESPNLKSPLNRKEVDEIFECMENGAPKKVQLSKDYYEKVLSLSGLPSVS